MDNLLAYCPNEDKIQPVVIEDRVWPSQSPEYLQGEIRCAVCNWPLLTIFKKVDKPA